MIQNLPIYISVVFSLTTLLTIYIFYRASNNSKQTILVILAWLGLQAVLGLSGFYTITETIPPRFLLLALPPFVFILLLFTTSPGKKYIDSLNSNTLTLLHVVRIPVEVVLFWLYIHHQVPMLMTFEGRNFDILSGITAPLVFYFGYLYKVLSKRILLAWNIICLFLLLFIVYNAVLSAPIAIQQFAFEQPNVAVLHFPFNWLPSVIVPIVLLSHLATIRQLIRDLRDKKA